MQPSPMQDEAAPPGGLWFGAERPLASRVLPPLLVTACIAADLAVYTWHTPRSEFPSVSGMIYLVLAFGQISLATIWASLARVERLFHWVAAGSAISLLLLALLQFEPAGEAWFLLIGIHVLALALPLRISGASLSYLPSPPPLSCDDVLPRQFSLGQTFLAISGAAILLGLLRAVDFAIREMIVYCSFGVLFAAIGWISVWAVFGRAGFIWRLLGLCAFGPFAGGLIALMTIRGDDPRFATFHALLNLLQSLFVGSSLLVLRIAGYRLFVGEGEMERGGERESSLER